MTVFTPNTHSTGKAVFAEKLAERGYTLVEHLPMEQVHRTRGPDGDEVGVAHSYFLKCPPSIGEGRFRDITLYKNGKRCFYVIGELPAWLPYKLVTQIERSTKRVSHTGLRIQAAVEALKGILQEPTKHENMNVMFNPQWLGPGRFVWGNIGEYAGTLTEVAG